MDESLEDIRYVIPYKFKEGNNSEGTTRNIYNERDRKREG